ncbi:MAG: hypothetical protein NZ108_07720 [Bacteroidia bacterium]|nr:hypothetical protein [Bacteroidia bacterium]
MLLEDIFKQFWLIGISSNDKPYTLAWRLNQELSLSFELQLRQPEEELKKKGLVMPSEEELKKEAWVSQHEETETQLLLLPIEHSSKTKAFAGFNYLIFAFSDSSQILSIETVLQILRKLPNYIFAQEIKDYKHFFSQIYPFL